VAVRADASTERTNWTTSLPAWNAFTAMAWVYIVNNRGVTNQQFIQLDNGAASGIYFYHNNLVLTFNVNGSATTDVTLSTGTWYHVAVTSDGSNARAYLDGVQKFSPAVTTFTPTALAMGGGSEWMDGRHSAAKVWSVALTADEIVNEMRSIQPRRKSSLWGWFPMWTTSDTADLSGNGHTATYNGTMTTEDGPPVGWGGLPMNAGFRAPTRESLLWLPPEGGM